MPSKRKFSTIYFGSIKSKKSKDSDKDSDIADGDIKNLGKTLLGLKDDDDSETKIEREGNHIYFYSEVNRSSILELIMLINEAEEESYITSFKLNIDKIPIFIHMCSNGGSIFDAFSAIDTIKACRVPVHTILEGSNASAATLISVVATKRFIRPNGYMLIHELSSGFWGKYKDFEDEIKNLKELMEKIKDIYIEHAEIPKKELSELLKHDLWLNSDKCLKYGLVDEIWT